VLPLPDPLHDPLYNNQNQEDADDNVGLPEQSTQTFILIAEEHAAVGEGGRPDGGAEGGVEEKGG